MVEFAGKRVQPPALWEQRGVIGINDQSHNSLYLVSLVVVRNPGPDGKGVIIVLSDAITALGAQRVCTWVCGYNIYK